MGCLEIRRDVPRPSTIFSFCRAAFVGQLACCWMMSLALQLLYLVRRSIRHAIWSSSPWLHLRYPADTSSHGITEPLKDRLVIFIRLFYNGEGRVIPDSLWWIENFFVHRQIPARIGKVTWPILIGCSFSRPTSVFEVVLSARFLLLTAWMPVLLKSSCDACSLQLLAEKFQQLQN